MDYDLQTYEDYDILGNEYINLINLCFQYSEYFTLLFKNSYIDTSIKPYKTEIRIPDDITGFTTSEYFERRFFKCNDASRNYMYNITDNLFDLVNRNELKNKPEDPIFYRKDGSVFFWSMIHEGICILSNRENEDVMDVVSKHGWKCYDKNDGIKRFIPKYFL